MRDVLRYPPPHSGRIVRIFHWSGRGLSGKSHERGDRPGGTSREATGVSMRRGSHTSASTERRARLLARVLAVALLAPALGGCESLSSWFGQKDDPILDDPADKLYNEGLYLLNEKKDIKAAAKRFDEVERQNPYSEWARKALIMSAYANYEAGAYDDSINAARRYITLHPGSPDAAYAQFLIGSSYFDQIRDASR